MRTNEERIAAMHQRAKQLQYENRKRTSGYIQAAAVTLSFAAVLLLAFLMPPFAGISMKDAIPAGMHGSIFSESNALGYIIVSIVAFALGAAVTIFCFYMKKWQEN